MPRFFVIVLLTCGFLLNYLNTYLQQNFQIVPPKLKQHYSKTVSQDLLPKLYEEKVDSVVYIIVESVIVVKDNKTGDKKIYKDQKLGTGFFIDKDGHILSANHVVEGATTIMVFTTSGNKYIAQVEKKNIPDDLVLLKIKSLNPTPYLSLATLPPAVGSQVFSIGHPKGFGWAFCLGYVAKDSSLPFTRSDWMVLNMQINTGNSGGPIFDTDGNVIGIAEAFYVEKKTDNTNTGISYATKLETIKTFLNE